MKKLFASIILFALAGILFSSCSNSSKLFTKRHYRSGYFMNFAGKNRTVLPVAGTPVKSRNQIIPIAITKSENNGILQAPVVTSENPGRVQKIAAPQKVQISQNKISNSTNLNQSPALQNKQTLSEGNGDHGDGGERVALSLLWLVVVVILILWLIGVLAGGFGLGGGLINLLLVIALILFILWILRIW